MNPGQIEALAIKRRSVVGVLKKTNQRFPLYFLVFRERLALERFVLAQLAPQTPVLCRVNYRQDAIDVEPVNCAQESAPDLLPFPSISPARRSRCLRSGTSPNSRGLCFPPLQCPTCF